MTHSEKLTSMIAEKFFLPQYIYSDVYVKTGKQENEFCDCLLEFESVYIISLMSNSTSKLVMLTQLLFLDTMSW